MFYKPQWLFALILFLCTSSVTAQWNTQSPVPTFLDVRGVGAPTTQHVFIATDDNSFDNGGALFESNDGGATWVQRNIPFSLNDPFYGLFFLDSQIGWAYGNDNYRTTDGGITWIQLPFLGSTYFMKFYTSSFGLATGNFDQNISQDGGLSWEPSPNNIFAFDFLDNFNGLGTSENGIFRSTDGGNTFTSVYIGNAKSVVYLSTTITVGIVDDAFIRSTDGGVTWSLGDPAQGKHQLLAVSPEVILAWGRTGSFPNYDDRIFRSSDGGQSWTDLGEVMDPGAYAVSFSFAVPDPQTVVASDGAGNMFYSSDAGQTWAQSFNSSGGMQPSYLSSAVPSFADAQIGYFGYGSGFVIKTTNSGASWFQISSGTVKSLNDIDRFANGNLITVGDNGTILTNSGGTSQWVLQPAISQYKIKAVHVVSPSEVVLVDEIGQVYKSVDAGETWTATGSMPPNLSPAEDIHFTTILDGWVLGQGFDPPGVLYHTTDGGDSWTAAHGFGGGYVALDVQGTNIWAANVTGRYYRSNDGGATWIQGDLPSAQHEIRDMDFFNQNIGYAVGWWGEAFRSDDGGVTWQVLPTPYENDQLTDIYLLGPDELWISTNENTCYYTANGGLGWSVLDIGSAGYDGTFSAIVANSVGDAWTVGEQGFIEHFTGPPPPPLNQPPSASFEYNATGLSVDFIDTSTDLDGTIVSWYWEFDDGNFSTEQNPTHIYSEANTYWVELTVTDDDGATGIGMDILTVQPLPGGTFGDFTEVTPLDSLFFTPQDEDFWVVTTAPADYDADGDLDIAILGFYVVYNISVEYKLVLIRNDGPAGPAEWEFSYIDVPLGALTAGSSDLAWGDVDSDGDLDLAVGTDGVTVIYRNDTGTLALSDTELPAYWEDNDQADFDLRSITWADYDNDGDLDLLIPSVFDDNTFTYRTALMRNDGPNATGGWIFTETDSVFTPTTHAQSAWADYDGDLDLDLLLINIAPLTNDGFIRRYRNDGNGVFVGEDILDSLTIDHGEAQWGDYDADGDLDILVVGDVMGVFNQVLRIYRNDDENYVPLEVIPCPFCEGWFDLTAATWADYDSDGDMDILLAGNYNSGSNIEGRARIYTNSGGIFTADTANTLPAPRATGDRGGTFSWFDLDGEGDLDYFIAGQYFVPGGNGLVEAQMHVYRNDVAEQNEAPSIPTGLNATLQSENTVLLSWIPSTDDHTPSPAITYDIVIIRNGTHVPIGTNGPQNTILTRLPEPGNISAVTEWSLIGLKNGVYEWRLRAVDAAYVGSDIAIGEFSIGVSSTDESDDILPLKYTLEQNYPNPFNPITTIRYSIPEEGLVSLKVYNLIGEEVVTLVNEIKQSGNYDVIFDAAKLSSGVYMYKIQAGSFVETRKMILMK
ncbi:MAG: FG-GAP-like repeat-containing protein [Ignavibacteria bacterium]|nr:FG-GAP-like repeat-containing protein [Ignavibacteria bacterium]